jgi:light-regulated signal transduction histidine kinase (bacteriophytochrome)
MKNMGVRASMSISLIVRNRLWGLISCLNHTGPRRVSHRMRSACEFMGRLASLQIAAFEDRERLASRASRRATEDALHRAMKEATGSVLAALVAQPRALIDLVDAGGVAVVENGEPVMRRRSAGRRDPRDRAGSKRGRSQAVLFRFLGVTVRRRSRRDVAVVCLRCAASRRSACSFPAG